MLNISSDPLLAFEELGEGSKLSLEILSKLRAKINAEEANIEEVRGLTIMLPHDLLHPMLEEEITHLRDLGITIVGPEETQRHDNGPLVIGAGFPALCMPLITKWNENDVKAFEPIIADDLYATGPTAMKRGGNNKPWYDLELKRRKAKIAKQSKRRNRK